MTEKYHELEQQPHFLYIRHQLYPRPSGCYTVTPHTLPRQDGGSARERVRAQRCVVFLHSAYAIETRASKPQ